MKWLWLSILIVLILPYIIQFILRLKAHQRSDFLNSLGSTMGSGFGFFDT